MFRVESEAVHGNQSHVRVKSGHYVVWIVETIQLLKQITCNYTQRHWVLDAFVVKRAFLKGGKPDEALTLGQAQYFDQNFHAATVNFKTF